MGAFGVRSNKKKMTLKELIDRHHWLSIESELTRLYHDEETRLDAYQDVFYQLRILKPEPSSITIRLSEIVDEDESYVDVDGYYTDGRVDKHSGNDALALDFTPWNQWLGMPINTRAFEEFTELEIIAHCLYELTFIAFDQEEIKGQLNGLRKTVDEYENMTPEERKKNTTSLEDFLKELNDDKDFRTDQKED